MLYFVHSSSRGLAPQITGPGRRLVLDDVNLNEWDHMARKWPNLSTRYSDFGVSETLEMFPERIDLPCNDLFVKI